MVIHFLPKNERKQVDLRYHSSKVEFVRSFFGGIEDTIICFRGYLTFSTPFLHLLSLDDLKCFRFFHKSEHSRLICNPWLSIGARFEWWEIFNKIRQDFQLDQVCEIWKGKMFFGSVNYYFFFFKLELSVFSSRLFCNCYFNAKLSCFHKYLPIYQ